MKADAVGGRAVWGAGEFIVGHALLQARCVRCLVAAEQTAARVPHTWIILEGVSTTWQLPLEVMRTQARGPWKGNRHRGEKADKAGVWEAELGDCIGYPD